MSKDKAHQKKELKKPKTKVDKKKKEKK